MGTLERVGTTEGRDCGEVVTVEKVRTVER